MLIAGICAVVLALSVVLGFFIWGLSLKNGHTVFPNICVSGVNIGGMGEEEAKAALDESLAKTHATRTLTVQLPDRKLVFDPEMANSPLDTDAMVETAMAYGREGGAFKVLRQYFNCKKSAYILDMEDFLQVDTDYVRELIEKTAEDVKQDMVQSEISMDEEKAIITITLGYNGRTLNTEKLYEKVMEAYNSGDLSDITFNYDVVPYDIVDLQSYYEKYCTSARDAYYDKEKKEVVPEVQGYGFDLIAANAQLALAEEGSVIEIPLAVIQPRVTAQEYMAKNFPDVLSTYSSNYWNNADRTNNLKLACEAINGTVLQPGEVFSFNDVVGERTADKGYKDGIIFTKDGKSENEVGGGICQVVSSVYMCALQADMQVLERKPHMYPVGYVNPGLDATVYWGAVDFKFKNDYSKPILIQASVANGKVTLSFLGTKEHDYTVKMTYELVETIPYEEKEILDETKPAGFRQQTQQPHTGYVYWSYKNYYDLNGNFLRKEKCAISEYEKYDSIVTVGPEEKPELPEGIPDDVLQHIIDGTIKLEDWLSGKFDRPSTDEDDDFAFNLP